MRDTSLDVAVTGVAARFPGPRRLEDWWEQVCEGAHLTTRYSTEALVTAGADPEEVADPSYVPVRGHLDDPERFDYELFGISPREAGLIDPQHRILLEMAWAALEDAGQSPRGTPLTTGVFASASSSGHLRAMIRAGVRGEALVEALRCNEPDYVATRVAYRLGLRGPAMTVLSACSSSAVALHQARQALIAGECDQAVVVAAAIDAPQAGHLHVEGSIYSRSGVCRPFDILSDGAVAGSGACAVVLRRLGEAVDDGSPVYGSIVGSAVNNDGAAKAGYSSPSADGQRSVLLDAITGADLDGTDIGYLEAHGTGTRIGDTIEWAAAAAAFGELGARPGQIAVGSLKANIGHLDAASGLASLIKALLVVRSGVVPPMAGFTELNPLLEQGDVPLHVPGERSTWTGPEPRRAGVSSFGIGGTNVHLVVEEPPPPVRCPDHQGPALAVLSAASPGALADMREQLADALSTGSARIADVAHTLARGRTVLPYRWAGALTDADDAQRRLRGPGSPPERAGRPVPLLFLFPGQGAQRPGMARGLFAAVPGARDAVSEVLDRYPAGLRDTVRRGLTDPDVDPRELRPTAVAQASLFALELGVARSLTRLGLAPSVVCGHSLGEVTAAVVAGALSDEDAAAFVVARGEAMAACPTGAMLAVHRSAEDVRSWCAEHGFAVEIAAVNTTDSCVVAGAREEVERVADFLEGRAPSTFLPTDRAFHSVRVEPAAELLRSTFFRDGHDPLRVALASNVEGALHAPGGRLPVGHFADHVRRPVMFARSLERVATAFPEVVAVEVGPGGALSAMAEAAGIPAVPLARRRDEPSGVEVLQALGDLWVRGSSLDVTRLVPPAATVHLPGTSFRQTVPPAPSITAGGERIELRSSSPAPEPDAPGGDDPERWLSQTWQELLGVSEPTPDADFTELGGDSVAAVTLARRLNQRFGLSVRVDDLMARSTLRAQQQLVSSLRPGGVAPAAGRRRTFLRGDASEGAPARVVCFPHAGGSAVAYHGWSALLAPFEVRSVQYPGRADRTAEGPARDLVAMAADIGAELARLEAVPTVLFGHSMGAAVAFEVARWLEANGSPVAGLVASAMPAPHTDRTAAVVGLDDDALVAALTDFGGTDADALADPLVRDLVLPYVRADMEMLERYRPSQHESVACPVTVVRGTDDASVDPDDARRWAELSTAPLTYVEVEGGHFYLSAEPPVGLVREAVEASTASSFVPASGHGRG